MNAHDLTSLLQALSAHGLLFLTPESAATADAGALAGRFDKTFYKPHAHPQLELICLLHGAMALHVNGAWRACQPLTVQAFIPGTMHGEHFLSPDTGYRLLWTTILPAALLFHMTEYDPVTGYTTSKQRMAITPPMCDRIWRTVRAPDFADDLKLRAKLHSLLMESLVYFLDEHHAGNLPAADFHEQIVEHVKHYIGECYWEDISLARLARMVHYSPGHLNAVFRRAEKMPVHRYISEVRLLKARQLLEHGGMLVKQAAQAAGFHDPLYFSRMFARRFGVRPTACLARARRSGKPPAGARYTRSRHTQ